MTSAIVADRFAAARDLAGKPEAADALGAALATETDDRVREALLTALARIGDAHSASFITPLLRSDDASLRTGALDALRLMPDAVAIHLPVLLADADPDVRLLATELARDWPDPRAGGLICELLTRETEVNVCAAALEVLVEIGGPGALPVLADCEARFAHEPFLIFSLRVAADRLSGSGDRG